MVDTSHDDISYINNDIMEYYPATDPLWFWLSKGNSVWDREVLQQIRYFVSNKFSVLLFGYFCRKAWRDTLKGRTGKEKKLRKQNTRSKNWFMRNESIWLIRTRTEKKLDKCYFFFKVRGCDEQRKAKIHTLPSPTILS